jgi:hypothetical protein
VEDGKDGTIELKETSVDVPEYSTKLVVTVDIEG